MKHTLKLTIVLIVFFLISQLIGLVVIHSYDYYFGKTHKEIVKQAEEEGKVLPEQPNVTLIQIAPEPIETKNPVDLVKIIVNVFVAIILGFFFFFLLTKIGVVSFIKIWFTVVVLLCLSIAFTLILYPFIGYKLISLNFLNLFNFKVSFAEVIGISFAAIITFFKIFKKQILVHNLSELFIYPGFVIVLLPILNVVTATALMLAISIYDIIAVWKSNYMVNLARFQVQHLKIFSGFFIPYIKKEDKTKLQMVKAMIKKNKNKKAVESKLNKIRVRVAALGGGDVAIPMLFLGTILLTYGLLAYFITLFFTIVSLSYLLFSAKDKAYPAMPFLSVGSLTGFFLFLFLRMLF